MKIQKIIAILFVDAVRHEKIQMFHLKALRLVGRTSLGDCYTKRSDYFTAGVE